MATEGALPFRVVEFTNRSGTVSYRVTGSWKRERIRENFRKRADAETYCNTKNAAAFEEHAATPNFRLANTRLTETELASAQAGVERARGRWPLSAVIDAGLISLEAPVDVPNAELVAPLLEEWLALIEKEVGSEWYRTLKNILRAFIKAHPGLTTDRFDRKLVRAWLDGRDVVRQTKANARNAVHRFGAWMVERGKVQENPGAGIRMARIQATTHAAVMPAVFSPLQAEAWLRATETAECRRLKGWVVLCMLCGLRPANEAPHTVWPEIDLKSGVINVLGRKRGGKPRVFKLHPTALAWLRVVRAEGEGSPGYFSRPLFRRAREIANEWLTKHHPKEPPIAWEEDIQRHTFASYRLGLGVPMHKVAEEEMGTSVKMIYGFYRNPRKPADVKAFWKILPKD